MNWQFFSSFYYSIIKYNFMAQSNHGGSKTNSSTSKQPGDKQRSSQPEKGKTAQSSHGAQSQKGREDMGKGKMSNQREGSDRSQSVSDDDEE
jgi:hypothetical protein